MIFNYDYNRRDGETSDDCMMRRKAGEESEREREREKERSPSIK